MYAVNIDPSSEFDAAVVVQNKIHNGARNSGPHVIIIKGQEKRYMGSLDFFQRTRKIDQIIDIINRFIVFYLRGKGNVFVLTYLAKYCCYSVIRHFAF